MNKDENDIFKAPAIGADDDLPAGPYAVGLTYDFQLKRFTPPHTVFCGDGRCIAGHIPSLDIAKKIAAALNAL